MCSQKLLTNANAIPYKSYSYFKIMIRLRVHKIAHKKNGQFDFLFLYSC